MVESTHFRQCSVFLHNFFSTIHYVHPILDKTSFLERCEILWSGDAAAIRQVASFVPLYYSVLSLGALVGYRDAEPVGGISNQKWSRKFFNEARLRFTALEIVTDLEMVQCYFFLAKVCQNELNSHCESPRRAYSPSLVAPLIPARVLLLYGAGRADCPSHGHQPPTRSQQQEKSCLVESRIQDVVGPILTRGASIPLATGPPASSNLTDILII